MVKSKVIARSTDQKGVEISWLAAICNGDFEYMG